MNSNIKPYRLINHSELASLQEAFECELRVWNAMHALFPLSCLVSRNPKPSEQLQLEQVSNDANRSLALIDKSDLSMLKYSLFGETSDCFNGVTEALFMALVSQLLGTTIKNDPCIPVIENWFYKGAPTLALALTCAGETTILYLNPQWVINALPTHHSRKAIASLRDALAGQSLDVQVEISPLPLKLSGIMQLQVGDVVKTDHLITTPAKLTYKQHPICHVDIGKSDSSKSILTTRTS